jgi:hypothetical protein
MLSFITGFIALVFLSLPAQSVENATYFRAWQGFKAPALNQQQFLRDLAPFMRETVDLYQGRALNNYIVIVPPAGKPAFVPDEFALVALSSKEDYQAIRATPEGERYSARHWDVFDRSNSKSADPMVNFTQEKPTKLAHNYSYDVIGKPIDWSKGRTMVYIGLRKPELTPDAFLTGLARHLSFVKQRLQPKGLLGYVVIANDNYEVAYMNWENEPPQDARVGADGATLLNPLMYQEAKHFQAGDTISHNKAYSTLF